MYLIITIWFLQEICTIHFNGVYDELQRATEAFDEIVCIEKFSKIPASDASIIVHASLENIERFSPGYGLVLARHVYNEKANYRACILLFKATKAE